MRPGERVELVRCADAWTGLRPGDRGTVLGVDGLGMVHVAWDDGSRLGLVPGDDEFRVIGVGARWAQRPPRVKLIGEDGNAFAILGRVGEALGAAGYAPEEVRRYVDEATYGDYDHLLLTTLRWVDVE